MIKQCAPDLIIVEKRQDSFLPSESEMTLAEERARLLVYIFGRFTSVVFDVNSIQELFCKEA
jgi:hypothetical protein